MAKVEQRTREEKSLKITSLILFAVNCNNLHFFSIK